jgi:hypothetical protein
MKKKTAVKVRSPRRRPSTSRTSTLVTPALQGSLQGPRLAAPAAAQSGKRGKRGRGLAAVRAVERGRAPTRRGTVVTPAGAAGLAVAAAPAAAAPGGNIATAAQIEAFIRQSLAGKLASPNLIRLGDASFYVPTLAELRAIIARSQGHRKQYTAERFDCDDFAYVLKGEFSSHFYEASNLVCGIAAGIIWGLFSWIAEFHSANFGITSDHGFVLIEPQSGNQPDKLFPVSECRGSVSLVLV